MDIVKVCLCTSVWITIVLLNGANTQSFTQGPVNTASLHGDSSKLHCRIDTLGSDSIEWVFFPNGTGTGERIYMYDADGEIQAPYENYDVDAEGLDDGIFDLIVKETSVVSAGVYQCKLYKANKQTEAQFVSVAPVTCDPDAGTQEIIEGASINLRCEVGYTGYKPPSLTWSYGGSELAATPWYNYERSTLVANVTAVPELDEVVFTCDLGFRTEGGAEIAAPVYNDTCSTFFYVLHGATRVEILPDPDPDNSIGILVGEYINCSASGRPPPAIRWEDEESAIFMVDSLRISEDWEGMQKTFTCVALNELNGVPIEARLSIALSIDSVVPTDPVKTGGTEPWVIAVAVVVPLVVLGAAGGTAGAIITKRKKRKKKKAAMGQTGGGKPFNDMSQAPPPHGPRGEVRPPRAQPRPPFEGQRRANGLNMQNAAVIGGVSVETPAGADSPQRKNAGRDSPGYGDLGIKQFGSAHSGLDSSVETDPDPRYFNGNGAPRGPQRAGGNMGSKASLDWQRDNQRQMDSQASLARQAAAQRGRMGGSQASIGQAARGTMGSQGSLSHQAQAALAYQAQAARGTMGSQGSLSHQAQAARGAMGSQGSLASQGSRGYNIAQYQVYDAPDTTV